MVQGNNGNIYVNDKSSVFGLSIPENKDISVSDGFSIAACDF